MSDIDTSIPAFLGVKKQAELVANPLLPFTDDQLIAAFRQMRDVTMVALNAEFDAKAGPVQSKMKRIQSEMHRRLLERKAKHSTTDSGTAYLVDSTDVECTDKMQFLTFCVENFAGWGKDLLTANAAKATVELYIEKSKDAAHPNGLSPPGLTVTYATKCNIRK